MPIFFELNDRHVLLCFSHHRGPFYYVGDYDAADHEFHPERLGRLVDDPTTHEGNIGSCGVGTLYAPSVLDEGDRMVAFFNVIEGGDAGEAGWSGVMSLPRTLSVSADVALQFTPVAEVEALRSERHPIGRRLLSHDDEVVLEGGGTQLEVQTVVEPDEAETVTLRLLRSPDCDRATEVTYYPRTDGLSLDTAPSATATDGRARQPETARLRLGDDEPLRLRVFVDRSVVEVFANGQASLTGRVYPERGSDGLSLRARGGDARLAASAVHRMAAAPFNGA